MVQKGAQTVDVVSSYAGMQRKKKKKKMQCLALPGSACKQRLSHVTIDLLDVKLPAEHDFEG